MKPKTKIQKAVWSLASRLPELTQSQIDYASKDFFVKYCYATKNAGFCLECGCSVNVSNIFRKRVICDCCGSKLKVEYTRKQKFSDGPFFFGVTHVIKNQDYNFQVVRVFEFRRHYRKGEKPRLYCDEICQNWYEASGKRVIFSKMINGYNGGFFGNLEVRTSGYFKSYNPVPDIYCPTSEFWPEYARKGINHKIRGLDLQFIKNNIREPKVETLIKAGYYEVVASWNYSTIVQYWSSLKICFRNNYKIKEPVIYKDLLSALAYLEKDLHNAHYVCPKNLKRAHDYYIRKKNEKEVGKTIAANLQKAIKHTPKYIQDKQKFLGLEFGDHSIKIRPLRSVVEFLEEGEILKHCVFKAGYYDRQNSLVLSARIRNKPVETIEVSIDDYKVVQAYGYRNKRSKYHAKILKLVNAALPKIKELNSN